MKTQILCCRLASFVACAAAAAILSSIPAQAVPNRIVFQRGFVDEQFGTGGSLHIVDPAAPADEVLFGAGNHPNYSPDGSQIVFDDANGQISKTPAANYVPTHLVLAGGGSVLGGLKPKWSPDSMLIAFGTGKIVITSAACISGNQNNTNECSNTTLDQSSSAVSSDPEWYPGFASNETTRIGRVIFVRKASNSATVGDIFATDLSIDSNGKAHELGTENLTNSPSSYEAPRYSHDGAKIIFVQGGSLHLMDADGTNQHPIVSSANSGLIFGSDPAFSPDDSKIVWGDHFIYSAVLVINANGSVSANNITGLTNSNTDRSPSWSGDAGSSSVCVDPPSGLISLYSAENDAKDSVGGNYGTLKNGASFAGGEVGLAFQFGENKYVSIPDAASLHPSSLTVEGWINLDVLNPGHSQSIFTKALGAGGDDSFAIWYFNGALHGVTTDATGFTLLDYSWQPAVGTWHHVAYTFNGTSHALYVDGSQVATGANTHVPTYDAHAALIGADYYGDLNSSIIDFFLGRIDELSLYSRALTADEVQSIFSAGAQGKCQPPTPPAHGGLSATTLKINGSSSSSSALTGPVLSFTAQQTGRPAELALRVQSTTTPLPNDASNTSWTDLPTGTDGRMVYDPSLRQFVLNTTGYPIQAGLYFRAVSSADGYDEESISNYVGTFDGSQAGAHLPPLLMLMARNGTLADLSFTVGAKAAPASTDLHIQTSTTPATEASWTNLEDGQTGRMHRSTNTNYPDVFLLKANRVNAGAGIYFRAIAKLGGSLDSLSNLQGPFTLTSDTPPTVNISLTNSTSGTGTVSDPYVLPAGQIKFSITAAADPQRPGSQIVSLQPRIDGKTIQNFDHAPVFVDFRYTQIGDHVLEAVAIDDLRAFGRAGTGAVYIRVIPEGSTALNNSKISGRGETAATASSSGKTYTFGKNNAVWSDPTAWTDRAGNHGVPGANDTAKIGSLTVGLQVGPNNDGIGTVNVTVGSIELSGGRFFGNTHATLTLKKTFTISGGEIEDLDMTIEPEATCLFINDADVTFGYSTVTNNGTWAIHGRGNIKGLGILKGHGKLDFQISSTLPSLAEFDPTAGSHVVQANSVLPLGGLMTGVNPNALISQDGVGLVNGAGTGLIGNAGGTLVGNAGGTLVGNAGGTVISRDASGIVSHDGGGIVSHDGGGLASLATSGLIGNDGAGLVAAGAGNLVAAGAGNFLGGGHAKSARSRTSAEATPSGFIQEGGETDLSAATIAGPVTLNGGVLSGSGLIVGDLANNGAYISPGHSAGALVVLGGFAQGANGTLIIENGGATPDMFDQLLVAGPASLSGKLVVHTINGFTPDPADTFNPLGYNSVSGNFTSVSSNTGITFGATGALLTTNPSIASPIDAALRNISTRARIGTGGNVLIGGFIVTGPSGSTKKVMVRGLGPSLAAAGLTGLLSDPLLELHNPDGSTLTNDNWADLPNKNEIPNGFAPLAKESVIIADLGPGNYTVIQRGAHGETGVGLAEIYDLNESSLAHLGNIATRAFVDVTDNVLIGGFIVGGTEPGSILVRAIGPSLTAAGVTNALADPILELHDANGSVFINDDWRETQESEIVATTIPPSDSHEPAILATLVPGNYTVIVRGKDDGTGIGLVEAYNVK